MQPADIAAAVADDPADVARYLPPVLAGLDRFAINSHLTRVGVFATIATECDWKWLTELGDPSYLEGRTDLGNTQPGDGAKYRGRGFVMLTGRNEYTEAGAALGIDLVDNPLRAADPTIAGLTLAWYFSTHGIPAMCAVQDWRAVRVAVNGGLTGWERFITCIGNLLTIPDTPEPTVTTIAVAGPLYTKPTRFSPEAIGPNREPVVFAVGTVVTFTPDPRTRQEVTPSWAHVAVKDSPVHGWALRENLTTTGG